MVGPGTNWEAASLVSSLGLGIFLEGIATNFRGNSLNHQPYNIDRDGKNINSGLTFHLVLGSCEASLLMLVVS